MSSNLVIIPTYNEKENIANIIRAVFDLKVEFNILVVDDNSKDGTSTIVKELQNTYPNRLHILERPGKLGLGTAYIAGFKYGIGKGYDNIYEMDADFSHDPADLVRMEEILSSDKADVVVGSRYVKGGKVLNWPVDRRLISYGGSLYTRIITMMPVKDPTAGFVAYKSKVLESMDLNRVHFVGYAFQIQMKFAARQKGFRIMEIPIVFKDREAGTSKMSGNIVKEAALGVIIMKWKSLFS